jgi:hypothetical protein
MHNLSVDEELSLALGSYEMLNNVYEKKKKDKEIRQRRRMCL